MSAEPNEPVGTCECGGLIYRKHRSGVPPKRCDTCRESAGAVGGKRGPRAAEHENRGGRPASHTGPIIAIRRLVAALPSDQRPGGVTLHVQAAAAALTGATGIPELVGAHIVEAMQALVEDGETGEDVRRRLNPSPFGRTRAQDVDRSRGPLGDYLEEAGI